MSQLDKAFNPESFRKSGHQLIDLLADYLESFTDETKAIRWQTPDEEQLYWSKYNLDNSGELQLFKDILDRSIHVHDPKYMGHQVAAPAPVTALSSMLSALLNNGMAVYEMGAAATAIEQVVCRQMCHYIGYNDQSDGVLTSGGTLANLTAMLCARQRKAGSDIWADGMVEDLVVLVSSEAHYCVDRALRIMGLGDQGIIKVAVDDQYRMDLDQLELAHNDAISKGKKVLAVVGSAPSTSTGMYDDLAAIADFAKAHDLWFHVDAAHGGAAVFSDKYKGLLTGVAMADSIVVDAHKMMMTPALVTFLLFKNKQDSYATFSQKAQYLWEQNEQEEWYNLAKRTFECTKRMMSIQIFTLMQMYGPGLFDEFVTRQYDLARWFATFVESLNNFEIAVFPDSNIVCFRYINDALNHKELDQINAQIRKSMLEDGRYYIVQTTLDKGVYMRITIMNPNTTKEILESLIEELYLLAINIDSNEN